MKFILEMGEFFSANKIDSIEFDYILHSSENKMIRFQPNEITQIESTLTGFELKHELDKYDDSEFEERLVLSDFDRHITFTIYKLRVGKSNASTYLVHHSNFRQSVKYRFDEWFYLLSFLRKHR